MQNREFAEPETIIEAIRRENTKAKNPYTTNDLKRYVWVIARLGGWKGYERKRIPGITTL